MTTLASLPGVPVVDQVIDAETYAVILDLGPIAEQILRGIAETMSASTRHWSDTTVGQYIGAHIGQTAHIVAQSLQITLDPRQASALAEALDEASAQPEVCEIGSCERLSALGDSYCGLHGDLA